MLVKDIVARLSAKRRTAVMRHLSKNEECADLLSESKESRTNIEKVKEPLASISIQQWINNSCCANVAINKCSSCKMKTMSPLSREDTCASAVLARFDNVCKDIDIFRTPMKIERCEKQIHDRNKDYLTIKPQEESKSLR